MPRAPADTSAAIGTCPCPVKGCKATVPVFKYRARAKTEENQRFAGKLYVRCDEHGRLDPQDFILEHATITGKPPETKPEAKPDDKPAPAAGGAFGFFR